MTAALALTLGYLAPWAAGTCAVGRTLGLRVAGDALLAVGLGGLLGLFGIAGVTYLWGIAGFPYNRIAMLLAWTLPTLACAGLYLRAGGRMPGTAGISPTPATVVLALLLGAVALHAGLVALEVFYRPIYPFDALTAWATKAKVWTHAGHWVEFADKELWLRDTSGDLYTDHMPDYPIYAPLLQLWAAILAGGWHSTLINVAWLQGFAILLLIFAGALRRLGASGYVTVAFTFFLATLPLLNTHVALAGYSDLWMGTTVLAAFVLLALWLEERRPAQLTAFLILAALCPLVKNEGLFWGAALVVGWGLSFVHGRTRLLLLIAAGATFAIAVALFPEDRVVAGHSLAELELRFHAEAVLPLLISMFLTDSWHLAYVLALLAVLPWTSLGGAERATLGPLFIVLLVAHALFMTLFFFTGYAAGAVALTAVSRINLALVPAVLFFTGRVFSLAERTELDTRPAHP